MQIRHFHNKIYVEAKNTVKEMIATAKSSYYSDKIENATGLKDLFKIVDNLLSEQSSSSLPSTESYEGLADMFSDKISIVHNHLSNI